MQLVPSPGTPVSVDADRLDGLMPHHVGNGFIALTGCLEVRSELVAEAFPLTLVALCYMKAEPQASADELLERVGSELKALGVTAL